MRRWRVGTLTMGVSLIVLGILLLISLLGGNDIVTKVMTYWPIILVMIGGEILLLLFKDKEGQEKIKYDGFSIVMIFLIFIFSMGFYSLSASGIFQHLTAAVNSHNYTVTLPMQSVELAPNIRKVVVVHPGRASIEISGTDEENFLYHTAGEVFASSKQQAQELLKEGGVSFETQGEELYIYFSSFERINYIHQGINNITYRLAIPAGLDVEVKSYPYRNYYSKVMIEGDAVTGNWLVKDISDVQVTVHERDNFTLEVLAESYQELGGNINWQQHQEDEEDYITAQALFGEGAHRLNIYNANVEALLLP
ncbi:hypothetical protein [Alkaliphilus crotonatoxidans]